MSDHFRRSVAEFHQAMGTPRFTELNRFEQMACAALQAHLIMEEGRELREAYVAHQRSATPAHREHMAKETADLLYVTVGAAHILSTPLADPTPEDGIPAFFAEGHVIQRAGRVIDGLDLLVHQIDIGWEERDLAASIGEIGSELQDLARSVATMAVAYGFPLVQIFDAVHASNMSKLDPQTGAPVLREDGKILKGPAYRDADLSFLTLNAA